MNALSTPPGFWINLLTFSIARALWISSTNKALHHRTGFLFAYFLQAFANYGLAQRLNGALASIGSRHAESPIWCFLLTGIPLIGANRRMRRGVARLNEAIAVRAQATAIQQSALVAAG